VVCAWRRWVVYTARRPVVHTPRLRPVHSTRLCPVYSRAATDTVPGIAVAVTPNRVKIAVHVYGGRIITRLVKLNRVVPVDDAIID